MTNYDKLKAEIESWGPIRPSDAEALAIGNAPNPARVRRVPFGSVPIPDVLNYLAGCQSGTIAKLIDAETDKTIDVRIRSAARAFNLWTQNPDRCFDLDSAPVQQALGAFQAIGAITSDEVAGLMALADKQVGKFENLIGRPATLDDIERSH